MMGSWGGVWSWGGAPSPSTPCCPGQVLPQQEQDSAALKPASATHVHRPYALLGHITATFFSPARVCIFVIILTCFVFIPLHSAYPVWVGFHCGRCSSPHLLSCRLKNVIYWTGKGKKTFPCGSLWVLKARWKKDSGRKTQLSWFPQRIGMPGPGVPNSVSWTGRLWPSSWWTWGWAKRC